MMALEIAEKQLLRSTVCTIPVILPSHLVAERDRKWHFPISDVQPYQQYQRGRWQLSLQPENCSFFVSSFKMQESGGWWNNEPCLLLCFWMFLKVSRGNPELLEQSFPSEGMGLSGKWCAHDCYRIRCLKNKRKKPPPPKNTTVRVWMIGNSCVSAGLVKDAAVYFLSLSVPACSSPHKHSMIDRWISAGLSPYKHTVSFELLRAHGNYRDGIVSILIYVLSVIVPYRFTSFLITFLLFPFSLNI